MRDPNSDGEEAAQDLWLINAVPADMPGLRSCPLLAFDVSRAVMLAREGILNDWLTEDEAWPCLLYCARQVQYTYDSWEAYGMDFILRRRVWAGKDTADLFDQGLPLLLSDAKSPWNTISWDQPTLAIPRAWQDRGSEALAWNVEGVAGAALWAIYRWSPTSECAYPDSVPADPEGAGESHVAPGHYRFALCTSNVDTLAMCWDMTPRRAATAAMPEPSARFST